MTWLRPRKGGACYWSELQPQCDEEMAFRRDKVSSGLMPETVTCTHVTASVRSGSNAEMEPRSVFNECEYEDILL